MVFSLLSWSPVDDGHVSLVGRRRDVAEPFDLPGAQLDAVVGGVLLDTRDPLGSRDRREVGALREQPGQRLSDPKLNATESPKLFATEKKSRDIIVLLLE